MRDYDVCVCVCVGGGGSGWKINLGEPYQFDHFQTIWNILGREWRRHPSPSTTASEMPFIHRYKFSIQLIRNTQQTLLKW